MDSVEMSRTGDYIDDTSTEQLVSLESSEANDSCGDPEVLPRVGEEYQAEIPTLIGRSEYILCLNNSIDEENSTSFPLNFLVGLPIPVTWITNIEQQESGESTGDSSCYIVESFDSLSGKMREYRELGYCLVPGSSSASWREIEKMSFVLGLYIFEKNFIQVKKFVEVKKMGNILSYYYGKFYRSNEYKRWSGRNTRYKRCAYGQRIFSCLRQQELLSRIFHQVSAECQNPLQEVSKAFGEGKISLEEYVYSIKAMVGIEVFVDSVGIGKGKRDLTAMSMEPSRSNQIVHTRLEIPIGKACASLTPAEITKFLNGDYRLSKARSNDLFWEAVWPRLLARGWQSQEPKDKGYAVGSKPSLVFLMPGIKKFSRRKLSKGIHYFDSITDVLGKVASEPALLKLDNEEAEGNKSKEHSGWTNEIKVEEEDSPERQRHCYLQPRTPCRDSDLMKFTIVDTSLNDEKTLRVRELRCLPTETSKVQSFCKDSSDVSTDGSGSINQGENNSLNKKRLKTISDMGVVSLNNDSKGPEVGNTKKKFKKGDTSCQVKQIKRGRKPHLSQRLNHDDVDDAIPVAKRSRKLNSCNRAETSQCHETTKFSVGTCLEEAAQGCDSDTNENVSSQLIQSKPCIYSSKDCPSGSPNRNSRQKELHPRQLIDLNLPIPQDFEVGPVMDSGKAKESDERNAPNMPIVTEEQQQQQLNDGNTRRHSTRNRPPTVRVLEALANGFLTTNRRQRVKERSKTPGSSHAIEEGASGSNSDLV